MKRTNRLNLPEPFVVAVESFVNRHKMAPNTDASVTELLGPPLIRYLRDKHYDERTEDYEDMVWLIYGQVVHAILEHSGSDGIREIPIRFEWDGVSISGTPDHFLVGDTLWDWKFVSVYSIMGHMEGGDQGWEEQTNIYRYGIAQSNPEIAPKKIKILCMGRDWGPRHRKKIPHAVTVIDIPVWPEAKVRQLLSERIAAHKPYMDDKALMPPCCTSKERWVNYKGEAKRCMGNGNNDGWCGVASFCPYRKKEQAGEGPF